MIRSWLLRLAPVVVAALFGAPRTATAAELTPARQPTGVAPAPALGIEAVLAREARPADLRLSPAPYGTPAASYDFRPAAHSVGLATPDAAPRRSSSPVTGQPPARAPPVRS